MPCFDDDTGQKRACDCNVNLAELDSGIIIVKDCVIPRPIIAKARTTTVIKADVDNVLIAKADISESICRWEGGIKDSTVCGLTIDARNRFPSCILQCTVMNLTLAIPNLLNHLSTKSLKSSLSISESSSVGLTLILFRRLKLQLAVKMH